ncbi:MAG: hypothetical protein LQ338_001224 [Usnochroma carphineum]|nr:MAG: hypothetical protein LQ338_001224 [Usnochroma carphineum]
MVDRGGDTEIEKIKIHKNQEASVSLPKKKTMSLSSSSESAGEVYGSIPFANVLSVFSLGDLLECMTRTPTPFHIEVIMEATNTRAARRAMALSVNRRRAYSDGVAIGQVLLQMGIPKRYCDDVCTTILADWRYPEHKRQAWLSNGDFVRGLEDGYQHVPTDFSIITAGDEEEGAYHSRRESELNERDHKTYFGAGAANQNPSNVDEAFMRFLAEVEEAAAADPCQVSDATSDPDLNHGNHEQIRIKQESPDCMILEGIPDCFRS